MLHKSLKSLSTLPSCSQFRAASKSFHLVHLGKDWNLYIQRLFPSGLKGGSQMWPGTGHNGTICSSYSSSYQRQQRFRVYFLCVYCIYYVFMFKIIGTWRTICNCMGYKIVAHLHLHRTQGREQSCMLPQTLELWPAPGSHKSWLIFQGAFGQEPDSNHQTTSL